MRTNTVKVTKHYYHVNTNGCPDCSSPSSPQRVCCTSCGHVFEETVEVEEGTVWERVTTTHHGEATFSYDAGDDDMQERRLLSALRRAVGQRVSVGYGHYGHNIAKGLSVLGTYKTTRI